jgi:acyl-CoA synthetase (AMP-forming)/AMP-acid ligase II
MSAPSATQEFFQALDQSGSSVALSDCASGRDFTYSELEDLASKAASRFSTFARPGDRIVLLMPNCPELIVSYLACLRLGAVSVPINADSSKDEIARITAMADPAGIVTELRLDDLASGERLPAGKDLLSSDDELAHIVFTSGTTGTPKAIPIRFGAILNHARMFVRSHGLDASCRFYNVLPLAYLGGWYNLALVPLRAGGTIVLDRSFGTGGARFWSTCLEKRVNCLWVTPSILALLAAIGPSDEKERLAISSQIRWAMVGMAPLQPSLKARFEETFGLRLQQSYGLSETLLFTSWMNELETPASSVGKPMEGYEVRVEENGEILVRGSRISAGYWNQPELTSSVFRPDGFLKTGDLGRFDGQGRLYITGRAKDLIIRGGVNISPAEIEDLVLGLEGIREAAVVGVEDELYGEKIVLFATMKKPGPGPERVVERILAHCREHLSASKVPSRVHILEAMPLNASGKIQKAELRKLALPGPTHSS